MFPTTVADRDVDPRVVLLIVVSLFSAPLAKVLSLMTYMASGPINLICSLKQPHSTQPKRTDLDTLLLARQVLQALLTSGRIPQEI